MRGSEIQFYGDTADLDSQLKRFAVLGDIKYTMTFSELNAQNVRLDDLLRFLVTALAAAALFDALRRRWSRHRLGKVDKR